MTVEQIIKDYLEKNKLDGLFNSIDECACLKDDLAPCDNIQKYCKPGIKVGCKEYCEHEGRWHIEAKK